VNYELANQKAIEYENNSPNSIDFLPYLMVGVNHFALKKVIGKANNWLEFGKWRYDYLKNGNDELSEEIKLKARGKSISNAVNVAEQFRNRFKNEIKSEIKDVSIGTEEVPKKDKKGTFRMSFIEITLIPSKKDDDN
jgi:DNA-binding protein Alba